MEANPAPPMPPDIADAAERAGMDGANPPPEAEPKPKRKNKPGAGRPRGSKTAAPKPAPRKSADAATAEAADKISGALEMILCALFDDAPPEAAPESWKMTPSEKKHINGALAKWLAANENAPRDIPPGVVLLGVMAFYALPRVARPPTTTRLKKAGVGIWGWIKKIFTRRKRAAPDAGGSGGDTDK